MYSFNPAKLIQYSPKLFHTIGFKPNLGNVLCSNTSSYLSFNIITYYLISYEFQYRNPFPGNYAVIFFFLVKRIAWGKSRSVFNSFSIKNNYGITKPTPSPSF